MFCSCILSESPLSDFQNKKLQTTRHKTLQCAQFYLHLFEGNLSLLCIHCLDNLSSERKLTQPVKYKVERCKKDVFSVWEWPWDFFIQSHSQRLRSLKTAITLGSISTALSRAVFSGVVRELVSWIATGNLAYNHQWPKTREIWGGGGFH